jgi:hypothetical protein
VSILCVGKTRWLGSFKIELEQQVNSIGGLIRARLRYRRAMRSTIAFSLLAIGLVGCEDVCIDVTD